jgi:AbrB family looped-hinge helix DNA binding protein
MIATIDKAGRVVIPAPIRERMALEAGTPLEVTIEETSIRLTPAVPPARPVRRGRRLVAQPTGAAGERRRVDVAALIEEERNRWP